MKWTIEYFEQADTTQPAEVFEDELDSHYPKLSGKLMRITVEMELHGHQLGGGYIEKCREYEGIWEIRVIYSGMLAREFFGFDGERIVLLHGYTKRVGEAASERDMKRAHTYWLEYKHTRHVSPIQVEIEESDE